MPIPQGPSEEQLFQSMRNKQPYRYLRYKATCLIVVGIAVQKVEDKGYPFWYAIHYLVNNAGIRNPTKDIVEQGHKDWQPWYRSRAETLMSKPFEDSERSTYIVKRGPFKGTTFTNADELYALIEKGEIDKDDVYENVRTEESNPNITDKTIQLLRESPKFFSEADPSRPESTKDFDYEEAYLEIDYPTWLKNKKALVPKTTLDKYFDPEKDVPKGMDISEARLRAIEAMTRVLRDTFWSIRIPTPKHDPQSTQFFPKFTDVGNPDPAKIEENWLHKQITERLANIKLNIVSGQVLSVIGVGVIEPRGIDQIFSNEKQAIDAVNELYMADMQVAAGSSKKTLVAEYGEVLVRMANLFDDQDQTQFANEIDQILADAGPIRFSTADVVKGLVRIADRLDSEGNTEQALVIDDVLLAIQANKYSDGLQP